MLICLSKVCRPTNESSLAVTYTQVYVNMYFTHFEASKHENPLGTKSYKIVNGMSKFFSNAHIIRIRFNDLNLNDNLFFSEYNQRKLTYYDIEVDDYYINDAAYSNNRYFSCNFVLSDAISTTTTTRKYKTYWYVLS